MPYARSTLTRQELEAENARLRAQLIVAREVLQSMQSVHDWGREADTGIYRCRQCGIRARTPAEVLLSCAEYGSKVNRKRSRARPAGIRG